ncbi:MAG: beta-N-acetylhexosaminidase [Armatimonadetes bacterium]|nr:beta-N-acetylhexosaminidase [Armatimonadota bacterium]
MTRTIAAFLALAALLASGRAESAPASPAPPPPPLVIPQPKRLMVQGPPLRLDATAQLVVADDATAEDKLPAETVRRELATRFGLPLPIVRAARANPAAVRVVFGEPRRMPLAARLLRLTGTAAPSRPEGYAIQVGTSWLVVAGHDPAGTFYGAQTLCQLLGRDTGGAFVPAAQVDDYPTLPWRGAHLFLGNEALPFHEKLIARVFARFKMNNLVLECEQAKWDTLGPHVPAWAMPKSALRREVAFARRYHMAVTPLVESVGHMQWLLHDLAYRDLAEDPQTPYAVGPANSQTYDLLFRLYDEVEDTFHAPVFCIGGDEVTEHGRYPFRSRGRYPTAADAYVAHVTRLHNYLKAQGVRTMLWGDMLLARGEAPGDANAPSLAAAQWMRARLPKDILIADWRYAGGDDFASPQVFQSAGFGPVLGATFYDTRAIARFAQSLAATHQEGLLQTTWAGYNSSEKALLQYRRQFVAFILAAEYAWSGRATPPEQLPYDPDRVFTAAYGTPNFTPNF